MPALSIILRSGKASGNDFPSTFLLTAEDATTFVSFSPEGYAERRDGEAALR